MFRSFGLAALAGCLLTAHAAIAAPIVDGKLTSGEYGAPLFVQNTRTQFGDSGAGDQRVASGSEIDALYGRVVGSRLYVLMTGNLESNFNKWDLFIDSEAGGQNQLSEEGGAFPEIDGFCCGAPDDGEGALQRTVGLKFDAGFTADHYLTFTNGNEQASNFPDGERIWAFTTHYSEIKPAAMGAIHGALGGHQDPAVIGGTLIDKNTANPGAVPFEQFYIDRNTENVIDLRATIDNSNVDGVTGSGGPDFAAPPEEVELARAVTTGIEFSIPLSVLGVTNPNVPLKISTFINGGGHDFASNQWSGGVLQNNLGGDGNGGFIGDLSGIDLTTKAGDQFIVIPSWAGDMNGDGSIDNLDIGPFAQALTDPAGFMAANPGISVLVGDVNADGTLDNLDIGPFAQLLAGGSAASVPEPSTLGLALLGLVGLVARRR